MIQQQVWVNDMQPMQGKRVSHVSFYGCGHFQSELLWVLSQQNWVMWRHACMPEVGPAVLIMQLLINNMADLLRWGECFKINLSMDLLHCSCIFDRERLAIGLQISAMSHCTIALWFWSSWVIKDVVPTFETHSILLQSIPAEQSRAPVCLWLKPWSILMLHKQGIEGLPVVVGSIPLQVETVSRLPSTSIYFFCIFDHFLTQSSAPFHHKSNPSDVSSVKLNHLTYQIRLQPSDMNIGLPLRLQPYYLYTVYIQ